MAYYLNNIQMTAKKLPAKTKTGISVQIIYDSKKKRTGKSARPFG